MSTVHIRKTIDSETLHLPELRAFLGKTVEITIAETATGVRDWPALRDAAGADLIDPDVAPGYREFERQQPPPRLERIS